MNYTDTAVIEGIKKNPEFVTFNNMDELRAYIMGTEETPAPAPVRAPVTVRRFIAAIRRYTLDATNDKKKEQVMVLANKCADRYFSTNRAFHYAELALQGHGRAAIEYIVQAMDRNGYSLEGVTLDCTPAPKKMDPNACKKCAGKGNLSHYYYYEGGVCFDCNGTGTN